MTGHAESETAPLAHGRLRGGTGVEHDATLEHIDGERALVVCAAPYAPGKPAQLTLALEPPLSVALKTIGSKRRPDGLFDVRARIVTLTREDRARLATLARPSTDEPG